MALEQESKAKEKASTSSPPSGGTSPAVQVPNAGGVSTGHVSYTSRPFVSALATSLPVLLLSSLMPQNLNLMIGLGQVRLKATLVYRSVSLSPLRNGLFFFFRSIN